MYQSWGDSPHELELIDDIVTVTLDRSLDVQLEGAGTDLLFPAPRRIPGKRHTVKRIRWLTPEDATRLLAACGESRNGDLTDLVEFALFTGLRRGEVLDLTWERVDRARGVIVLDVTKSGKRREVPLNSRADAVLARRGSKSSGLVFGTRKWDHFRSAWQRAVNRAKLVDFHFHDLRHHGATMALNAGFTREIVMTLGGWKSGRMIRRYAAVTDQTLRAAAEAASGHESVVARRRGGNRRSPACPISASGFWTLTHASFALRSSVVKRPWCSAIRCASVA